MKKTVSATRIVLFALLMLLILVSVARAQSNDAPQQNSTGDNPPSRVARLSFTKGNVSFLRAGLDHWSKAPPTFPVTTGTRIYTDKKERRQLEVGVHALHRAQHKDVTVHTLKHRTV